jgi:cytochrome b pre-mRNA-processing protein 3
LAGSALMLEAFRTRATLRRKAGEIYGAIVTQARQPGFYAKLGIPDTPIGRYDMVVLHLFLVLERLRKGAPQAGTLARALIEAFVTDMDDSLRELGTGDVGVGKKVRRAAAGFYERSRGYREALAAADRRALEQVLARYGLVSVDDAQRSGALAAYVLGAAAALAAQEIQEVVAGRPAFARLPDPAEEGR